MLFLNQLYINVFSAKHSLNFMTVSLQDSFLSCMKHCSLHLILALLEYIIETCFAYCYNYLCTHHIGVTVYVFYCSAVYCY